MNISIGSLKRKAFRTLRDYLGTAMLAVLTEAAITLGGSYLASALFSGSDSLSLVLYQVFAFGVSLIASIFSAGLLFLFLNIARKKKAGVGDLFYFFKNHPDRVIVASFLLSLIQLVCMIPCYFFQYTSSLGNTPQEQLSYLVTFLVLLGGGQIIYIVVTIPFAQTYLLMADDLSLGGVEAMKKSAGLMKGAKYSYLLLLLSFAPMLVLSAFLLYIPLIWVVPHLLMSQVFFYEKLINPDLDLGEGFGRQPASSYVNKSLSEAVESGDTLEAAESGDALESGDTLENAEEAQERAESGDALESGKALETAKAPEEPDFVQDCEAGEATKSPTEPSRQVEDEFLEVETAAREEAGDESVSGQAGDPGEDLS